ncbi:MAG: 2-isopropylmalate synthase [Marinobacter sp.]|nr:2-isopropylmalate synthase [Marinobacter sp.]
MRYSEAERQFYLGMAGIRAWYAREPLPGAAPSPEFEFPEESELPAFAEPLARSNRAAAKAPGNSKPTGPEAGQAIERIANLQAMMAGENASGSVVATEAVAESKPEGTAATASIDRESDTPEVLVPESVVMTGLKATLGVWQAGNVLLLGELSEDASTRLQDSLANNILKALGYDEPVKAECLRWPVFANPLVPGNSFADFTGVLKSLVGDIDGRRLILLGLLVDTLPEDRGAWLDNTLGQPAVDFPHTLAELAAVPSYKRALWEQLKPLVRGKA